MKFKVLDGKHIGHGGKVYKKGKIVTSDVDLAAKFKGKFERVDKPREIDEEDEDEVAPPKKKASKPSEVAKVEEAPAAKDEENAATTDEESAVTSDLGDNVTEDYPAAEKKGLLVLKKGSAFFVAEEDAPNKKLNPKPLKQKEVVKFLDAQ